MKTLLVARKYLLEIGREFQLLAITLGLPAFFMLITYVGYGTTPKLVTYTILVHSNDARSAPFIAAMQAQRYPDGRPAYLIREISSPEEADERLKRLEGALLLDFQTLPDGQMALEVRGDATSMAYIVASTRLGALLGPQVDGLVGKPQFVRFNEEPLVLNTPPTDFDAYTPGMMIFGVLLLIPQTAMLLGREMRTGTLRRLRLTGLTRWELLGGVTLSQMIIAAIQVLAMFAMALGLGFQNHGSLLLAIAIAGLLAVSAVGNGLWVAGFVSDDSQAMNIGSVFTMLQVFLSGSFFALPSEPWFTIAGHSIGLMDLLPATHTMLALKQVMVSGAGLGEVAFRIGAIAVLSVIYLTIGIALFRRHMD